MYDFHASLGASFCSIMENVDEIFQPDFESSSVILAWTQAAPVSTDIVVMDMKEGLMASVIEYPNVDAELLKSKRWEAVATNDTDGLIFALDLSGRCHIFTAFFSGRRLRLKTSVKFTRV